MIYPPVLPVFFAQFGKNDLLCRCTADASYTQKTASHLLVQTRRGLFAVFGLGYRRNHVPERGLAALPLPVIL